MGLCVCVCVCVEGVGRGGVGWGVLHDKLQVEKLEQLEMKASKCDREIKT